MNQEPQQQGFSPAEVEHAKKCCENKNLTLVQMLDMIKIFLDENKNDATSPEFVEKIQRIKQDLKIAQALEATKASWDRTPEIAAVRPPLMESAEDEDTTKALQISHWNGVGSPTPGVWNPYRDASLHAENGGWAKVSLHAHTDDKSEEDKTEYLPGQPSAEVVTLGKAADFQLIGLVANQAESTISEEAQEHADKADENEAKLKLIRGTEYLFESGVGPHFGVYRDYPELTQPFHPTMGVPFETPGARYNCPPETLFAEELTSIHFIEMANGYVRLMDPEPYNQFTWRSDTVWDQLLSDNCLLWGAGSGDAFQGIKVADTGIQEDDLIDSQLGLVYSVVCVSKEASNDEIMAAYRAGCSYVTTGVELTEISVNDEGEIRVCVQTPSAGKAKFRIVATTNHGAFLCQSYKNELQFDPWKELKKAIGEIEEGKSSLDSDAIECYKNASYVRITVNVVMWEHEDSKIGQQRVRQEYAWTQPFWLTLDGFSLARDRRVLAHRTNGAEGTGKHKICSLKDNYANRLQETFSMKDLQLDCF